ncbi:MAG: hypothetical protein JO061_09210 [Acidobacteriaceae bacterium]|nr:hypothetical protein [Acidobacteriaceae bacterium]
MIRIRRRLFAVLATIGLLVHVGLAGQPAAKKTAPSVTRIYIDQDTGDVHLAYSNGNDIPIKKWTENVSDPKVASDRVTAGWLLEDRAGTSYTVPQAVVVYRSGKVLRTLAPSDWPIIVEWRFFRGGTQVGFSSSALHGAEAERRSFELHDVQTGRILESWDDQQHGNPPSWVQELSELEQKSQH